MDQNNKQPPECLLGLDIGTSGIRGTIVRPAPLPEVLYSASVTLPLPERVAETGESTQSASVWLDGLARLFDQLAASPDWQAVGHIIADATSSTVLLCDEKGAALTKARMYDDSQASKQALQIKRAIEENDAQTAATGASSTLAKVLALMEGASDQAHTQNVIICHQIDFINRFLCGFSCPTDENNALKLGYDPVSQRWPDWVQTLIAEQAEASGLTMTLPEVVTPGTALGSIDADLAKRWGLSHQAQVYAGTTDSIAGFLASGAEKPGDAVSSLGSTLAIKLISDTPVFNAGYGIYSHRLGDAWLVGGASNTGGAVLLKYFELEELKIRLKQLEAHPLLKDSAQFETDRYYPLMRPGERFPVADATLKPRLPIPEVTRHSSQEEKLRFLFGLIQGLTHIEKLAYRRLNELGCPQLERLFTVGGGTQNPVWQKLRRARFSVKHPKCISQDASYGVTRLIKGL